MNQPIVFRKVSGSTLLFCCAFMLVGVTWIRGAERGRPRVVEGTIRSDSGTLLRGCYFSTDGKDRELPNPSVFDSLKSIGLNALHIYGECYKDSIGQRAEMIDSLVQWTGERGIYVVLTRGGCDKNGNFNYESVIRFWEFYGPRYADREHVIFEIMNEPEKWEAPYSSETLKMERDAYVYLRSIAPKTPICLFTYASIAELSSITQDIAALDSVVDWSNAAVAVHGYSTSISEQESVLTALQESGYPVISTEPAGIGKELGGYRKDPLILTGIYEKHGISWLQFNNVLQLTADKFFVEKIDSAGLCWTPDYGEWPGCPTEILRSSIVHQPSFSRSTRSAAVSFIPGDVSGLFIRARRGRSGKQSFYTVRGRRCR